MLRRQLTESGYARCVEDRPARPSDIEEIAMALPETEFGTSWGDRPTYKVRGRGFIIYRGPRKDAIDPGTGEPMDDVIVFWVPDEAAKTALVEDNSPFFTIPHFDRTRAVLMRARDLGQISRSELAEVITEGWLSMAPKKLARQVTDALGE